MTINKYNSLILFVFMNRVNPERNIIDAIKQLKSFIFCQCRPDSRINLLRYCPGNHLDILELGHS